MTSKASAAAFSRTLFSSPLTHLALSALGVSVHTPCSYLMSGCFANASNMKRKRRKRIYILIMHQKCVFNNEMHSADN